MTSEGEPTRDDGVSGPDMDELTLSAVDVSKLSSANTVVKNFNISPEELARAYEMAESGKIEQEMNQWITPDRPDGADLSSDAGFVAVKESMTPLPVLDGAYKRILVNGDGPQVQRDWLAYVHYEMFQPGLRDPVDSTFEHGRPTVFRIGRSVVIPFMDALVCSMKVGEEAEFYLEPHAAYERLSLNDNPVVNRRIRKAQPIRIRVFLSDFIANATVRKVDDLTNAEIKNAKLEIIYNAAVEMKGVANDFLTKRKKPREAQNRYLIAVKWLSTRDAEPKVEDEKKKQELMAVLCVNLARALADTGEFEMSLKRSKQAIKHASFVENPFQLAKAYYRAAYANHKLKHFEDALVLINKAVRLEPSDGLLREFQRKALVDLEKAKGDQCSLYKTMFKAAVPEGPKKADEQKDGKQVDGLDPKFMTVAMEVRKYIARKFRMFAEEDDDLEFVIHPTFSDTAAELMSHIADKLKLECGKDANGKPLLVRKERDYKLPEKVSLEALAGV